MSEFRQMGVSQREDGPLERLMLRWLRSGRESACTPRAGLASAQAIASTRPLTGNAESGIEEQLK